MSEARALGAKRRLQEAVLGHSSGAKAESLYHRCARDARVEAVDEPELNVWYRKDPLSKEAPKRAPEVARDAEGYPVEARRRLEILKNGQVKDLDTHQLFRQVKRKEGVRLVPIFARMKWKTEAGFETMKLLLDCVGEKGQYTLVVDEATKAPMTLEQWKQTCAGVKFKPFIFCNQCQQTSSSTKINSIQLGNGVGCGCVAMMNQWVDNYDRFRILVEKDKMRLVTTRDKWRVQCKGCNFKPTIECTICGQICTGSTLDSIQQGHRIGCNCNHKLWVDRQDEFEAILERDNMCLVTTKGEWMAHCTGALYRPTIECTICGEICTVTTINSIQQGQRIDCACNSKPWVERREEFEAILEDGDMRLVTTRDKWKVQCIGCNFKPTIECTICGEICTGTTINSITQGCRIDCACRNKTEGKLLTWLQKIFPDVRHNMHKLKNPDTGHYKLSVDFDVPSRMLAIELDGPQHFDPSIFGVGNLDGPKRDLEKEKQLLAKGFQLVRVLQDDVWRGRGGWENYLLKEMERWRLRHDQGLPAEPARCPDAPEYLGGIYAELRAATV